MALELTSAPAEEPVSTDDAKTQLRVETDDDDDLIANLISTARIEAEWYTRRAFITQSWTLWLDHWPVSGIVRIPLPPLISVSSVSTYSTGDVETVLDSDTYRTDTASAPARLQIKNALSPPVVTLRAINGVSIAYTAGYGDADDVPAAICQAIQIRVADLYANRGDAAITADSRAGRLLAPYRVAEL